MNVAVVVSAVDRMSGPLKGMMGNMEQLRNVGMKMAAVGGAITAGFGMAVKAAGDFQQGIAEVGTLVDTTVVDMSALSEGVRKLAQDTGAATGELTGALYQTISAGVDAADAIEFLGVASKTAIGGVTDVETAVDGLTTVINAWGLESSDAERVADSLFTAMAGGKTTIGELSNSMFNVAPAAAAAKVSFEEVNAAIATLTASGTPTSVATTQIRAALTGLMRPSTEMTAIFQKLGYENAQAAIEAEGLGFALNAVRDAAQGDAGALGKLLGSVEAVAAANVIAGTGAEKFAQEMENQANAAGSADAAYGKMAETLENLGKRLKKTFADIQLSIGEALVPALEKLMSVIAPVARAFAWLVQTPVGKWGIILTAVLGVLTTAVGTLLMVLPTFVSGWNIVSGAMAKAGVTANMAGLSTLRAGVSAQISGAMAKVAAVGWRGLLRAALPFIAVATIIASIIVLVVDTIKMANTAIDEGVPKWQAWTESIINMINPLQQAYSLIRAIAGLMGVDTDKWADDIFGTKLGKHLPKFEWEKFGISRGENDESVKRMKPADYARAAKEEAKAKADPLKNLGADMEQVSQQVAAAVQQVESAMPTMDMGLQLPQAAGAAAATGGGMVMPGVPAGSGGGTVTHIHEHRLSSDGETVRIITANPAFGEGVVRVIREVNAKSGGW